MSCNFMPCYLVRHFHVLQFHVRHFQRPRRGIRGLATSVVYVTDGQQLADVHE